MQSYIDAFDKVGNAISNTMVIPGISLFSLFSLLFFCLYLNKTAQAPFQILDSFSMIPYILPGSVIGITLLIAFNKPPLILSGTMTIMVLA